MSRLLVLFVLLIAAGCQRGSEAISPGASTAALPSSRVHHLEQLTQDEIDALDRENSIFFLTAILRQQRRCAQ